MVIEISNLIGLNYLFIYLLIKEVDVN
jgi:hypothetical protein